MESERTLMISSIHDRSATTIAEIEFIRFEGQTSYRIKSPSFKTIDEAISHAYDLLTGSDSSFYITDPENLRDCPHCGTDPKLHRIHNEKKMDEWYIQCPNQKCGYGGGTAETIQEAVENWNDGY